MLELHLMRHAEAAPITDGVRDFDRPLTVAGRTAAQRAAEELRAAGQLPERILSSPAQRGRETATIVQRTLHLPVDVVQQESGLYLAEPQAMLQLLTGIDGGVRRLLLVGHNPGISDLANLLRQQRDGINLATAGICTVILSCDDWSELAP